MLLIALLGITFINVTAQESKKDSTFQSSFKLHSLQLFFSNYNPEMDYFNTELLPLINVTDEFGSNYSLGSNITFSLNKQFRARGGFSWWKDEVQGEPGSVLRNLEINLYRFQLAGIFAPNQIAFKGFQPYAGVEATYMLVRNNTDMDYNLPKQKGEDFSFALLTGLEYSAGRFVTGLEFKYNLGSYVQEITDNVGLKRQDVSINGPELQFSIGYKFLQN